MTVHLPFYLILQESKSVSQISVLELGLHIGASEKGCQKLSLLLAAAPGWKSSQQAPHGAS